MDRSFGFGYGRRMHSLLALLLSMLLALASQTEAVARSEMAGAVDQVLCGAYGASTVTLDANGHPIPAHSCTHCIAAGVVADLAIPVILTAAPVTRAVRLTLVQTAQTPAPQALVPCARAPPAILV
ncbi:MAG: hypothetical protein ACOH2H_10020 [Cypionkella sp.]